MTLSGGALIAVLGTCITGNGLLWAGGTGANATAKARVPADAQPAAAGGAGALSLEPSTRTPVQPERSDRRYKDAILTEDTTWSGTVAVEGWLTVAPQATLTIRPGTVVRFRGEGEQGSGLLVKGRLQAHGSQGAPILFTSAFTAPLPGDWRGIVLVASEKKNLMEECRVEGAETGLEVSYAHAALSATHFVSCRTGLRLQDALATIAGGGALGCDAGFVVDDSEADLRDTVIAGNRTGVAAVGSSLTIYGCQAIDNQGVAFSADNCHLRFQRGQVSRNGAGMKITQSEGLVTATRLLDNREYGMALNRSRIKVNGNEIAGNRIGLQADDRKSLVWGNAIHRNSGRQFNYSGSDDYRLGENWWGGTVPDETGAGILDGRSEKGRGRVDIGPVLTQNPLPGW